MRAKDLLFGTAPTPRGTDVGLMGLRVYAGLALALAHGWGKVPPSEGFRGMVDGLGLPAPELFAWLAAAAEFGGGLLLAIGLLTRPVALVLLVHFSVVVLLAHAGDPFGRRELPLFFWFSALVFLTSGGGRYSLDALVRRGQRRP